jgi:hypothetical protein
MSKLSMVEGLVLLHPLSGADGDVIIICSLRNVIVCKIMASTRSRVAIAQRTKIEVSLAIYCHQSVNQSLGWMGQTRALASLHSTTSSSCTTLATTTHNKKYLAP